MVFSETFYLQSFVTFVSNSCKLDISYIEYNRIFYLLIVIFNFFLGYDIYIRKFTHIQWFENNEVLVVVATGCSKSLSNCYAWLLRLVAGSSSATP